MIAALAETRSRKSTPNRAVTSQENRLLSAVIASSTATNPTGYVALCRLDCRRRADTPDPGGTRCNLGDLFPDGNPRLRVRSPPRAPLPQLRSQPAGGGRRPHRPLLRRRAWSPGRNARAQTLVQPHLPAGGSDLSWPRMRPRCRGAVLACVPGRG